MPGAQPTLGIRTSLLSSNDNHRAQRSDLPIVKVSGAMKQAGQPSFSMTPFHLGPGSQCRMSVRRRIPPDAGRGLEKLGHALEYLTDEFVRDGCRFADDYGRVQAIQLLASLNRQIYFACAVEPTLSVRVQTLLRRLFGEATLSH